MHIMRRSVGLFLLGTVLGGIPLAIAFSRLGGRLVSAEVLRYMLDLTPLAIIVTIIGTLWTGDRGWGACAESVCYEFRCLFPSSATCLFFADVEIWV